MPPCIPPDARCCGAGKSWSSALESAEAVLSNTVSTDVWKAWNSASSWNRKDLNLTRLKRRFQPRLTSRVGFRVGCNDPPHLHPNPTPDQTTPHHHTSPHLTTHHHTITTSHFTTSHHTTPRRTTHQTRSHHTTPHHTTHHTTPHHTTTGKDEQEQDQAPRLGP